MNKPDNRISLDLLEEHRGLSFSDNVRGHLSAAFVQAKANPASAVGAEARAFVDALEDLARELFYRLGKVPHNQKKRTYLLDSISIQAGRITSSLRALDVEALRWLQSNIKGVYEAIPRTQMGGGEPFETRLDVPELFRQLHALSYAANRAATTLPAHDFKANEPRLVVALELKRIFGDAGIGEAFTKARTGLAFQAISEILSLVGNYKGDPVYWLRKAGAT